MVDHAGILAMDLATMQQALLRSESNRDHSKMKNENVKKLLEKSKNILEEKRKMVKQKNCIKKTNTFTIIAENFVGEKLKNIPVRLPENSRR